MNITSPQEHAAQYGKSCPACGSANINTRDLDVNGPYITAERNCVCGARWTDEYRLYGYKDFTEGD